MPEGPEIRRAADKIAKVVEGKFIEVVGFGQPAMQRHEDDFTGQTVTEVETRGKAMLTHFEHGYTIYSHNQLYGVWKTSKRGKLPKTKRSLRLALHTATHSALLYSASDISVWETEAIDQHPFLRKLGPDILAKDLQWDTIAERLRSKAFARRGLSMVYLDQGFVAGIGNYLRSEMLFDAGIHPDRKAAQLNDSECEQLARSTLLMGQRSYTTGGYTVAPDLLEDLQLTRQPYESVRFMVFNRDGSPCRACGDTIIREERSSRRIYWCPTCQPQKK